MGPASLPVRRVRPSRAGAPVRALAAVAAYLLPGYAAAQPYVCSRGGHRVTRLHRAQRAAIERGALPPCPRPGCPGLLHRTAQTDRLISDLRPGVRADTGREGASS